MKKALLVGMILAGASLNAQAIEVHSEQLNGCVEWTKSEALQHFSSREKGPCYAYNYAKWFEGGTGTYEAEVLALYKVAYGFDKTLGRAWIEIGRDQSVTDYHKEVSKFTITTGRFQVPGLRFDTTTNQIMLNDVAIASVKFGVGLFGWGYDITGVKPALSIVDKTVDDGFNWIYQSPFAVVTLDVEQ